MHIIEINNLSLYAGTTRLLENISFCIEHGQKIVLIGKSGSGKSLLSLAIMDLLPQNIIIHGQITRHNLRYGVILQNPSSCFDSLFDIKDHFMQTLKAHNKKYDAQHIQNCLQEVGLDKHLLSFYPFELSGGQLQRIMIAIALCIEPNFIIADEPTSDLDCIGQQEIMQLFLQLQNKWGFGSLFITHDLFLAAHIGEKIIVLDKGIMLEYGHSEEIIHNPQNPKTKELFAANRALFKTPWGDFYDRNS